MAIRAERNPVRRVENFGQQRIDTNDMMHFQGVRPSALCGLSATTLALKSIVMKNVGAKLIVQGRITDHHSDGLDSAAVVRVPRSGVSLPLQLSVAFLATGSAVFRLGRVIVPARTTRLAGKPNFGLLLRFVDTLCRAVFRNFRPVLQMVVRRNEIHRRAADGARVLTSIVSNPGERGFCWMPSITTHTSHSTMQGW